MLNTVFLHLKISTNMVCMGNGMALLIQKLHLLYTQSAYWANEIHKFTTLNLLYSSPFLSGLTLTSLWFWFLKWEKIWHGSQLYLAFCKLSSLELPSSLLSHPLQLIQQWFSINYLCCNLCTFSSTATSKGPMLTRHCAQFSSVSKLCPTLRDPMDRI